MQAARRPRPARWASRSTRPTNTGSSPRRCCTRLRTAPGISGIRSSPTITSCRACGTAPATPAPTPPQTGGCVSSDNPLSSAPVQRALFIALDEWATEGRKPPKSRVPKLKDGTLVPPQPQSGMGFPNIPSPFADGPGPLVTYTGLKTTRYHFDYGLNFYETGIATVNPPLFPFTTPSYQDNPGNGPIYPSFIPKTDGDG